MIDKDVNEDRTAKEESEMAVAVAAAKVALPVLGLAGIAVTALAASEPSTLVYNTGLTCLILFGIILVLGLLARWLRAVMRDNRATRETVMAAHTEITNLIIKGQQLHQDAIKESSEELGRKTDEIMEAFIVTARIARDEVDQQRRRDERHRMTRHI